MKVRSIDSAKHIISEMILKERDEHALLLEIINRRVSNTDLLSELTLVHNTRINLLDDIFLKLKVIK